MYLLGVIKRDWVFPLLYSFVVVTFFSFTTSWLYDKPLMYDSAVFQLIGKIWAERRVPYKDLWELKGPLVFLPSALGYWLSGSKLGVIGISNNIENYLLVFHDYKELAVYERIVNKLPLDFKSSFIAYDCDPELYLYFDIPPKYPFCGGQSFLINYGASIKSKIESCFRYGDA